MHALLLRTADNAISFPAEAVSWARTLFFHNHNITERRYVNELVYCTITQKAHGNGAPCCYAYSDLHVFFA